MIRRALTFGSVASRYERFRLGYPDQIVTDVIDYADRPIRTALEIGAGTGKATRVFAAHRISVTATEPDAEMIRELRKHVPESVTTTQTLFEELEPGRTYDLVFAAAALHWTRPDGRWPRIAGLLAPEGVFACFGAPIRLADADLENAVRVARLPWLTDDDIPPPDGTPEHGQVQWPGTELVRSELFTDVRHVTIERCVTLAARDFVGLLSTISAYLELPEQDRRQVLDRILAVLPAEVAVTADIDLHLARLA